MAIFSPTAGKRKGRVGGESYSVIKGQNVVKAKPTSVANPRTKKQVHQRAVFADAVEFFRYSIQNLFRMAFEDRAQKESDYNAFMRHNAKNASMYTKNMIASQGAIFVGNWMVSQGSLYQPSVKFSTNNFALAVTQQSAAITTIGQLSQAIISKYGLVAGDIVTIVINASNVQSAVYDAKTNKVGFKYENDEPQDSTMRLYQFILDVEDTTLITASGLPLAPQSEASAEVLTNLVNLPGSATTCCVGCAIIFSRNTDNGLLVSDSYMAWSDAAAALMSQLETSPMSDYIYKEWGASSDAILQGSLV